MQIGMMVGFLTALPANGWLIRRGWKEKMPQADPRQAVAALAAQSEGAGHSPHEIS